MANVRDSDTSLWLHNKLGTSNDSWTGGSICTQLNTEVLRNIKDCFPELQTQVKLKLLLSFFHIPRRNVEEWRHELDEIMEMASLDSELWVSMLAEVMRTLPETGSLNTQRPREDAASPVFSDMVSELRKLLGKHEEQLHMLPLECHYLNKAALVSVVGQQPNPVKHFTLKRKPKSAALRAELLQKSMDAMSNMKKSVAPTVPVRSRGMPRKMTDTTPLKGLPSRWSISRGGIRTAARITPPTPTARAGDRAIKILDIADQPATIHQKKRRKLLEAEEQQKKAAMEAEVAPAGAPVAPGAPPTPTTPSAAAPSTSTLPEYARGLNNYVMPSTPQDQVLPPLSNVQSPAVTPVTPTATATQSNPSTPTTPNSPHVIVSTAQTIKSPTIEVSPPALTAVTANTPLSAAKHPILIQQSPGQKPIILGAQQKLLITGQPGQKPLLVTAGPGGTLLSGQNILKTSSGVPVILSNSVLQQAATNAQGQTIVQQGGKTVLLTNVKQMTPGVVQQLGGQQNVIIQAQPVQGGNPPGLVMTTPVGLMQQKAATALKTVQDASAQPAQPAQPTMLPRRSLTLTKDQMVEAQDMFKNANRVTRPEKALILGFMAGSRENPCPNLGNIVTIKLSENQENVRQTDFTYLTMLCETHFQMNYNNGHWMRIKKYRAIEGATPQPVPQHVS